MAVFGEPGVYRHPAALNTNWHMRPPPAFPNFCDLRVLCGNQTQLFADPGLFFVTLNFQYGYASVNCPTIQEQSFD